MMDSYVHGVIFLQISMLYFFIVAALIFVMKYKGQIQIQIQMQRTNTNTKIQIIIEFIQLFNQIHVEAHTLCSLYSQSISKMCLFYLPVSVSCLSLVFAISESEI